MSKRNRRGVVWLLLLGLLISFSPRLYAYFFNERAGSVTFSELQERVLKLEAQELNKPSAEKIRTSRYHRPTKAFDPNQYTKSDWMLLGLSQKQAEVVLKFTQNGIYSNENLKKIFVIPEELYDLIKDSTYYPLRDTHVKPKVKAEKITIVDLSVCSKEDLVALPGIGDYFAKKIIDYRERLGGYCNKEQLKEIWKLDSAKYNAIEPFVMVGKQAQDKFDLNTATVDELAAHPYISYKVANSIVKMREQHGRYSRVEEIRKSKLISEELYNRIYPYLKVE